MSYLKLYKTWIVLAMIGAVSSRSIWKSVAGFRYFRALVMSMLLMRNKIFISLLLLLKYLQWAQIRQRVCMIAGSCFSASRKSSISSNRFTCKTSTFIQELISLASCTAVNHTGNHLASFKMNKWSLLDISWNSQFSLRVMKMIETTRKCKSMCPNMRKYLLSFNLT